MRVTLEESRGDISGASLALESEGSMEITSQQNVGSASHPLVPGGFCDFPEGWRVEREVLWMSVYVAREAGVSVPFTRDAHLGSSPPPCFAFLQRTVCTSTVQSAMIHPAKLWAEPMAEPSLCSFCWPCAILVRVLESELNPCVVISCVSMSKSICLSLSFLIWEMRSQTFL